MSIFDWIIGIVLMGFLLVWTIGGLVELVPFLTIDGYRHLRYTRKGVCYKCKRKFAGFAAQSVDQMYSDKVLVPVCSCKDTHYLPMGNRHFAEW
jgi:hypothetical protein